MGTRLDVVALTAVGLVLAAPASAQSPAELAAMKAEYRRPAALPVENRALAEEKHQKNEAVQDQQAHVGLISQVGLQGHTGAVKLR